MKTNEQTVADLIKRREEYDKKQLIKKRRLSKIAAALAAVMIFAALSTVLFSAAKTNNAPAPAPAETATETVPVVTADETKETPTEQATVKTETETDTGTNDEITAGSTELYIPSEKIRKSSSAHVSIKMAGDNCDDNINVPFGPDGSCIPGYPHNEIIEQECTVWMKEDLESVYVYFETSGSLEIIGDEIIRIDSKTNAPINVKIRYTDDKMIGWFSCLILNEENGARFLTDHKEKGYTIQNIDFNNDVLAAISYNVLNIKGYDFLGLPAKYIYRCAARYFGDVDENGAPLYYYDPYMTDYYNNPFCEYLRGEVDESVPNFYLYYYDLNYDILFRRQTGAR